MNPTKKSPSDVASEEPVTYGRKKSRPKIQIKTKADMANMDAPFPDETSWALELESDANFID